MLRRLPHSEDLAVPRRDGAMRLERVVHLGRGAVGRLDDRRGVLESRTDVAALQRSGVVHVPGLVDLRRLVRDRLLEIDDVRPHLVVDGDERERALRGLDAVRSDRRDLVADELHDLAEDRLLAAERGLRRIEPVEDVAHARQRARLAVVDRAHLRARVRAAQDRGVEHPGQLQVLRVDRAAGNALGAVDTRARLADLDALGVRGMRGEIDAVDNRK